MSTLQYRQFYIKKKNGKQRRICAPSKELLTKQRKLLPVLNFGFLHLEHTLFHKDIFHGFVPQRNCVTAALHHIGYEHTITLDISNCFDSISPTNIPDNYSMKNLITTNLVDVTHQDGTLAQGFATSPILANIYLLKPVQELDELLRSLYPTYALTVYADDIQISLPESKYHEMNSMIDIATLIFVDYGLTINKSKTRIHHAKYGNRRVLGIQVGDLTLYPNRRLKKKIRAARHQKNGPSLGGLTTASRLLLPKTLR